MSFSRIITSGAVVNFVLVAVGALIGILLKKGIPQRIRTTLMNGVALCVMYIGVTGIFESDINVLFVVLSCGIGAVIGETLGLDGLINHLGEKIENKMSRNKDSGISEGFVTATLLFCVGAMTIVGSTESGISGDNSTLYSKSLIDGISAAILASSLGIGVMLSAFPVLAIEGILTILAVYAKEILTGEIVAHMSVIGSLLIIAISLNMLGVTKIKVMNLVPAIFLPILFCMIF